MCSRGPSGIDRRGFLKGGAALAAGLSALPAAQAALAAAGANRKIVVGVMGTSRSNERRNPGRGASLAMGMARLAGAEVAYVCDVDSRNMALAVEGVEAAQSRRPKGVADFRRILDDKAVDALIIAAPDHWHAPAAIMACAAGKHVYVEKPCAHNPREGELLVAAARKHKRVVQHGTQRRSWPGLIEAVERLRGGVIGRVSYAKCWYFNSRPSIGRGRPAPVPDWLDYGLWQGPAPRRPYRDNVVHYNWHWFWHWGTGELGNNGVHLIDVVRWGLGVDYPLRVASTGGRYRYDDDQETPDTNVATFDFGDRMIAWEGRSCLPRSSLDPQHDVAFHGDKGTLIIRGAGYTVCDPSGKEIATGGGAGGDRGHLQNFLDGIRGDAKLNAEIGEGRRSAHLCHLGNIAWRLGRSLRCDPKTGRILDDPEAMKLWSREYEKGWEPK
ncbi:MAG: Gfo/Idh/MocA family oxidoreductase [Phycisphaerae bacterium]